MENNPENTLQITIPKKGEDKTNQDLLEDLKAISDEEIMKAGEEIEQSRKETLAQKEKRWEEMRDKGKTYGYEEWKKGLVKLKEGDTLDLMGDEIGAEGAREIAEKLKLKEGVTLDLTRNKIGDKGAKAIAENLELKEGVILNLSYNKIGDEMKQKLKVREESYHDKGINCKVII